MEIGLDFGLLLLLFVSPHVHLTLFFSFVLGVVVHLHFPVPSADLLPQLPAEGTNGDVEGVAGNGGLLSFNAHSAPARVEKDAAGIGLVLQDLENVELIVVVLDVGLIERLRPCHPVVHHHLTAARKREILVHRNIALQYYLLHLLLRRLLPCLFPSLIGGGLDRTIVGFF